MAEKTVLDETTIKNLRQSGTNPNSITRTFPKNMPSTAAGLPGLEAYKDPRILNTNSVGYMFGGEDDSPEGMKNRQMTQAMFVSPDESSLDDTTAHETEHLLARQNLGHPTKINTKFDELIGNKSKGDRIDFVRNAVMAGPYLEKKYGLDSAYFTDDMYKFQGSRARNLLFEQLAALSALEQKHKVDLTKDPELRKTLFKDPAVRETYNALTGLRQTRLDPRDLPPYTRQPEPTKPGMVDKLKKMLGFANGGAVPHAGNNKLI
jgi:hypothetical protein